MQVNSTQVNDSYVIGSTQKINSFTLSNSKEFFNILSKNLYSDPVRAVIRETICNAWDSHIKAGKTNIPIKATYDGDNIVVQDFGTGIPHEDIPTVYGVFGGSTKILDDTQTGGFGLGCKAPFAIAESFTVQDIYNGVKGIYSCLRNDPDNNGLPSIRTIVKVPTDEPNGIIVTIPYTEEYSKNRVNNLIEDTIKLGGILANDNEEIELPIEEEFTIFERNARDPYLMVRYGNVVYPIDVKKVLPNRDTNNFDLEDISVIFEAKPSTLSIAPSREGLVYDEKTIDTLFGFFKRLDTLIKTNKKKSLLKCIEIFNRKDLYKLMSWSKLESYVLNIQYICFYKYYTNKYLSKEDIVTLYSMYVNKVRYSSRLDIKHFFKKFPSCINKAMKAYVYGSYEHKYRREFFKIFGKDLKKAYILFNSSDNPYDKSIRLLDKNKKFNYFYFNNTIYLTNKITNFLIDRRSIVTAYLIPVKNKDREAKENYYKKLGFNVIYIPNESEPEKRIKRTKKRQVINGDFCTTDKNVAVEDINCYFDNRSSNDYINKWATVLGQYFYKNSNHINSEYFGDVFRNEITCVVSNHKSEVEMFQRRGIPTLEEYIKDFCKKNITKEIKEKAEFLYELITEPKYFTDYVKAKNSYTNKYFIALQHFINYKGLDEVRHHNYDISQHLKKMSPKEVIVCCNYLNDKLRKLEFSKEFKRFLTRIYLSNLDVYRLPDLNFKLVLNHADIQAIYNRLLRNRRK